MHNPEQYYHAELETMPRAALEALQLQRLHDTIRCCMTNPFYQKKFAQLGITPDDIRTLDDIRRLPMTTKEDLRENYPFGLACVPLRECTRLHSRSWGFEIPTL